MEKLLHEQLMKCMDSRDFHEAVGVSRSSSVREVARALARKIHKQYIPRPRFEDGEPIQWGGYVDGLEVPITAFTIHEDGSGAVGDWAVNDADWVDFSIPENNYLKRPQPKVLDADGVEIKVGDTVWDKQGNKLEVKDIDHSDDPEDQEHLVWCGAYRCGCKWWNIADQLTHKEPDSLEKLRDDMKAWLEYPPMEAEGIAIGKWRDRLSALIERGA